MYHSEEGMSMHTYPYMDPIKKEKLEAAVRFRRLQFLRRSIKVLLAASMIFGLRRFVLLLNPSESVLSTLNSYISKRGMFLLCNAIFAVLAVDSGMVAGQPSPPPVHREDALRNISESEGKEIVVSVGLEKEEARHGEGSIMNWELGNSLVVGAEGNQGATTSLEMVPVPPSEEKEIKQDVTTTWEMVPLPPSEEKEIKQDATTTWEMVPLPPSEEKETTFKVSEEVKLKWNDGSLGDSRLNKKFELSRNEQSTISWELVPVPRTMAEEVPEEESWDVMSNDDINKKFADFIAKTRRSWRQESMQLVVV